jgi:putative endonuclease
MLKRPTKSFGQYGEQLAVDYLTQQGYDIVTTNWHCKYGEIDIVAQKDNLLVFVEVKTRSADTTEGAFESITPRKQKRMTAAAQTYLVAREQEALDWRVDVIGIAIPRNGTPIIEHAEDALGW